MVDDTTYWNDFYNGHVVNTSCSDFCKFVMLFFQENASIKNVVDCGCGNGRDSYELHKKYNVRGVDNSGFVPKEKDNLGFSCGDFVTMNKADYDLVYSRFTFHSITNENHETFLNSIEENSFVAIEARSSKGEDDYVCHGKEHFRNYIDIEYLKNLLSNNFEILYIKEGNNMAKYKDEDPICIRVIARKYVCV